MTRAIDVPLGATLDALADRIEELLELEHGRGRDWSAETLRGALGEVRDRLRELAG